MKKTHYILIIFLQGALGCAPCRKNEAVILPKELSYDQNIAIEVSNVVTTWRIIQVDSSRIFSVKYEGNIIGQLSLDQSIDFSKECRIDLSSDKTWIRLRRIFFRPSVGVHSFDINKKSFVIDSPNEKNISDVKNYWGGYMKYFKTDSSKTLDSARNLGNKNSVFLFGSYQIPDPSSRIDDVDLMWNEVSLLNQNGSP